MPQIVKSNVQQSCPLEKRLKVAGDEVLTYRCAYLGCEHQALIGEELAEFHPLLKLCLAVFLQKGKGCVFGNLMGRRLLAVLGALNLDPPETATRDKEPYSAGFRATKAHDRGLSSQLLDSFSTTFSE